MLVPAIVLPSVTHVAATLYFVVFRVVLTAPFPDVIVVPDRAMLLLRTRTTCILGRTATELSRNTPKRDLREATMRRRT